MPYELDRPNRKPHRCCPQRVLEQLHRSTLPRSPAIGDRHETTTIPVGGKCAGDGQVGRYLGTPGRVAP
jgi:hypothetical protein